MHVTLGQIHEQALIVNTWADALRSTFTVLVADQNANLTAVAGSRLDRENAALQTMVSAYKTYSSRHASSIGQWNKPTAQSIRDTATMTTLVAA